MDHGKDICIPDSGTTHTILKSKKYFTKIFPTKGVINTISGPADLIEGTGNAMFILPNGRSLSLIMLYTLRNQREIC